MTIAALVFRADMFVMIAPLAVVLMLHEKILNLIKFALLAALPALSKPHNSLASNASRSERSLAQR
jgi:hypothetical protein